MKLLLYNSISEQFFKTNIFSTVVRNGAVPEQGGKVADLFGRGHGQRGPNAPANDARAPVQRRGPAQDRPKSVSFEGILFFVLVFILYYQVAKLYLSLIFFILQKKRTLFKFVVG